MTISKIQIALEKAVNGITPAISTRWPNTREIRTLPFQEVFFFFAPPIHDEFSTGLHRIDGILQINLYFELYKGKSEAMARAELIRSTFQRGTSQLHDGVVVTISRSPYVKPDVQENDRFMIPIDIEFFSHIT
jgi:hypothetical protein